MNGLRADALALARDVAARARQPHRCELLVCPPATLLVAVAEALAGSDVALGGQDCHAEPKGAFTGCISAEMLKDAGCSHAIVGHSERRHTCGETDADVRTKTLAAWRAGLTAIICIGETRAEREGGRAMSVVEAQIAGSLPDGATSQNLVVAYEPVWAIGTGKTATPELAQEAHAFIKSLLDRPVLYGGSVKAENAEELLSQRDVDGALVGGASLDIESFVTICRIGSSR
jgi:triosephosphate isomerase